MSSILDMLSSMHKHSCGVGLVLNGRWGTSGNADQQAPIQNLTSVSSPGKPHSDKCFQTRKEDQLLRQGLQEPGTSKGKKQINWNQSSIFSLSYISCWNEYFSFLTAFPSPSIASLQVKIKNDFKSTLLKAYFSEH